MRTLRAEVQRPGGWDHVIFEEVGKVTVAGAPGCDEHDLHLSLIGHRPDRPNQVEANILDIAERHEPLLDSTVPRTDNGTSLPLAQRDSTSTDSAESRMEVEF